MEFTNIVVEREKRLNKLVDKLRVVCVLAGYIISIAYYRQLNYIINYTYVHIILVSYLLYSTIKVIVARRRDRICGKLRCLDFFIDIFLISFFIYSTGGDSSFIGYFYVFVVCAVALKYSKKVLHVVTFLSIASLITVILISDQTINIHIALQIIHLILIGWIINTTMQMDKQYMNKLMTTSITDKMTGLYNYQYLLGQCKHEIARADRYRQPFSIALLDVDNFKRINDEYGHIEGDKVLREFGKIIRQNCRQGDIAVRYGGDEFVILMPKTDAEDAVKVAERLRCEVAKHQFFVGGKLVKFSISAGIANYPKDAKTLNQLLLKADCALYTSKSKGKNRVCMNI